MQDLSDTTAVITGASRGIGRATAAALAGADAHMVGVARRKPELLELSIELEPDRFTPVVADPVNPSTAGHLIDRYDPGILVLNASANPLPRTIERQLLNYQRLSVEPR